MEKVWVAFRLVINYLSRLSVIDYLSKLDLSNVKQIIKNKIFLFVSGFLGGGGSIGAYLFLDTINEHVSTILLLAKSLITLFMAFATGIATALGRSYVEGRAKEKEILKRKEELKQKLKDDYKDVLWNKNGTHD